MDVARTVTRLGGIAHRSELAAQGLRPTALAQALRRGTVVRVRRDWVATIDCAPELTEAVRVGGRLSCVSAARHHGLWVLPDTRLHVALPPSASRATHRSDVALHWSQGIIPPAGRFAVDSIENALYFVTRCRPHDEAVAVVDSALNKKLVRRGNLDALATRVGGTFARVVADADGRADSGLESLPRVRLARRGITMHPQAIVDGHAIDGLIGDRLLVQFDGDRFHSTPKARQGDREEDRWLALQGYTLLRFGTSDVLRDWPRAEAQIREAIAADLHLWPATRVRSLEATTRVIRARPYVV